MRWGQAIRRLELWTKRAFLARRDWLSLCPFDSFIWPSAPWVCLICHKVRKKLKFEKYEEVGVFTGGWCHRDGSGLVQDRAGGFFAEHWGRPVPVAQWWPRKLVNPGGRNIEARVKVWSHYNLKHVAGHWGIPRDTVLVADIYAGDGTPYVRADFYHPHEPRVMRITLFIP